LSLLEDCYATRKGVVDALERDVFGPAAPDEVIDDPPITQYICGILFPQSGAPVDAALDIDEDEGDESAYDDPPVAHANTRYPSSVGLTFSVDAQRESSIVVIPSAARYRLVEEDEARNGSTRWQREQLSPQAVTVDVTTPSTGRLGIGVEDGLEVFARVREPRDGGVPITLALVNTRSAAKGLRDADSFFQVGLEVVGENGADCFVERSAGTTLPDDADLRSYALLYRHVRTYAVGHGCAAGWTANGEFAARVRTEFVPRHDLPVADSNPEIDDTALQLEFLNRGSREEVLAGLSGFADGYEAWIEGEEAQVGTLAADLGSIADEHIAGCRSALARIRAGLDLLRGDDLSWEAFRLTNRTMWLQRSRSSWISDGKPTSEPELGAGHRWRPFQIAFILQCLPGVADPDHPDRELADLLWFPTGGGKTEAYLGLIAFTIYLRRLRRQADHDGVTVIMRYTLRLLTIQQFERAALLACCCEQVRDENPRLGKTPISVGLWIGRGGAPNTLKEARIAIDKIRNQGLKLDEGNPIQLHRCPWCGTKMTATNYVFASSPTHMRITCSDKACRFSDRELPVHIVDEDIYRARPSLIIATADKFASLPWKPDVGALFNHGLDAPPPELIVQDELHLISGPLGTLVGLYETAIDLLCTEDGHPPKVIASTATIRRAGDQTRGLFTREMRQFPPPGLDARNSYFAVESPPSRRGARQYVGVMSPGTSQTTSLVRTYSALLQAAQTVDADDAARDPYWTLVGYFNSLRVLAGARMQVQDDVRDRIRLIAGDRQRRLVEERIELTSREPSSEIPAHLARMATSYPEEYALDVILATNMISVGVDIDRLGLMVVMGQPQSTSEYIQGTSRVGRKLPGLILTIYNASRSRDRSHYESFHSYHGALYRQVESTSVTPFSPRARARGLHAVLIALARLTLPELADNGGAGAVVDHIDKLDGLCDLIVERCRKVDVEEQEAVRAELKELVSNWRARAEEDPSLLYSAPFHPDRSLLVEAARTEEEQLGQLPTLFSLRDVDAESSLYLVGRS
jgi:Helicase conserved C-terminal domain